MEFGCWTTLVLIWYSHDCTCRTVHLLHTWKLSIEAVEMPDKIIASFAIMSKQNNVHSRLLLLCFSSNC